MLFDSITHYLVIKHRLTAAMDALIPSRNGLWCLRDAQKILLPVIAEGQVVLTEKRRWGLIENVLVQFRFKCPGRWFEVRLVYPNMDGAPMRNIAGNKFVAFAETLREIVQVKSEVA